MHPLTRALLSSWEWRPEVLAVIVPMGVLYVVGWLRLRRQSSYHKLANRWRLASYLSGLGMIAISLMSPIDRLGGQLFFMHMIQHMLFMMFGAPLLWFGEPFPIALWGLPQKARHHIGGLFTRDSAFRRGLAFCTSPGATWLIFITIYLGWHDSSAYNAALYHDWVHDIQHITFFLASLLYWWPIIGAAPHIHPHFPGWAKLPYLIGTIPPNMFIGVAIAFSTEVRYTYYESVPRFWGFTVMQDQQIAGAIMWIPGSMMFLMAALVVLAGLFGKEKTPPGPVSSDWDADEAMIAPGLEDRVIQNRWRKVERPPIKDLSQPS
ncbi:MAG: cytochrome c oxidase assembly protein [Caldilineaceae bacterium]|nr:cytochrome c oxidase assembly protein [Caldilineaceae bacterium]